MDKLPSYRLNRASLTSRSAVTQALLSTLVGLSILACGQKPTEPLAEINESALSPSELELLADDPRLQPGMPFEEANAIFTEQGWISNDFMATGPLADWDDSLARDMRDLGFKATKTCPDEGHGLCKLEYVYGEDRALENGAVLSVQTIESEETGEPVLWSWGRQNDVVTTYADQDFSADILAELRQRDRFCFGVADCDYQKYAFKDALLITAPYEFGATKLSLLPREPISKEVALGYASVLDANTQVDLSTPLMTEENRETYAGCDVDRGIDSPVRYASTCFISLTLNAEGEVSEVSLHNAIP